MLVIRLQRVGRRGKALYRVIVQDSRQSPKSGKMIARLGSYDPHTKVANIEKEKIAEFIKNGAHPSERLARLLKKEGLKLPAWVPKPKAKKRAPRKKAEQPAKEAEGAVAAVTEKPAETEAKTEETAEPAAEPAADSSSEALPTGRQASAEEETPKEESEKPAEA